MHEWGDTGITAVFVALIVAVLLSVGVAQQARARAARYQEIRRLQSVAAAEAQREEAEAAAEYTSMVASRSICAICLNPTTTRCSRCKSVRYCSETCQVQHWKQGHRQECRPPDLPSSGSSGSSSGSSRNFSEVYSRSSSGASRTLSEVSDYQNVEIAAHSEASRASSVVTANGALLKPKKILFPYEYFVKFFKYDRLKVPPCGLINCGNSCFANVVLQCLTYTRPLTAYLLDGSHGEECRRSDWCFMCELQDHVWRVRQSQNPFSPIRILSRIRNIGNHLGYGRQEDAHEFMRFAIDSMQSICLDEAGGEKSVDPRSQETTFIHHIFGGHLQSQVQCMQCQHESNRYENMMDLAVEIHGSVETLEDALAQFTAPEWLDGDNKYKCDRCNAYVKARKRLTVHESPNILTIALKRFQSGKFGKLNKRVTFPEVLDMMPYMSGKGDIPSSYMLYAVVVHVDMLNASFFGHYICYVKDSQGSWYKIDDSKVKEVDLEKVMSQRAYMLFYTRSSARPPPVIENGAAAVNTPEIGSEAESELSGGLKVFPAVSPLITGAISAVDVLNHHTILDSTQMEADVERGPHIIKAHPLFKGENATSQSSSWEGDVVCVSTVNDDEISVENSGCVSSSASHFVTSPSSSSFMSNQELGFPTQVSAFKLPEPSNEEDTELTSWDHKSLVSSDLTDINLQVSLVDKPFTSKIGKRRLEDGLSPLPTPKPLDTDKLPAWPAANLGRPSSSSPVLHTAANQMSCTLPNEAHSLRQKYISEKNGESFTSAGSPVRLSSDEICLAASGEPGHMQERSDYVKVVSTDTSKEELVVRAKRQHIESGSKVFSLQERDQRPSEMAETLGQPDVSNSSRRDMEWSELVLQPGSPASVANCGPVLDSCADDLPAATNISATSNEVQAFPSSLRQVLLDQQVTDRSIQLFHSDEILTNLLQTTSAGRRVDSNGLSAKESWAPMLASSSSSSSSSVMEFGETDGLAVLEYSGDRKKSNCNGTADVERSNDVLSVITDSPESLHSNPPTFNGQPENSPQILCNGLPKTGFQSGVDMSQDERKGEAICQADTGDSPHAVDHSVSNRCLDVCALEQPDTLPATSCLTDYDGEAEAVQGRKHGNPQIRKSTLKPLFTPGFLNRGNIPSVPKVKSGSIATSSSSALVENGHDTLRETSERPACDHVKFQSEIDHRSSPNGVSHSQADNDHSQTGDNAGFSSSGGSTNISGEGIHFPDTEEIVNEEKRVESRRHGGIKFHQSKADGSLNKSRTGGLHSVNGGVPAPETQPVQSARIMEQRSAQPVHDMQSSSVDLVKPSSSKQKQGRNESCACGSQKKWKRCCGKSEGMKPEMTQRRLVV